MTANKFSISNFENYFRRIDDYQINMQGGAARTAFTMQILVEGMPVFSIDYPSISIAAKDDQKAEAIEVMDMCGLLPLNVEFSPASLMVVQSNQGRLIFPSIELPAKMTTDHQHFKGWFLTICRNIGGRLSLIPDTNFLRRHYYTNIFQRQFTADEMKTVLFQLSRLSLLEIENKYNRSKDDTKKDKADKERRLAYYTIREALAVKNSSFLSLLPDVDMELLQSFTPLSGKGFADSWIRREILEYIGQVEERENENFSSNSLKFVFLTCDMMNAFSANAEDLATFYFSRIPVEKVHVGTNEGYTIGKLVINTAIYFGKCECILKVENRTDKFTVTGMWSGKDMSDWLHDAVIVDFDPATTFFRQ